MVKTCTLYRTDRGYTLIEVMVASGIFLVFLTAVFILYVEAIKSYRFGDVRISLVQNGRTCMDNICTYLKKANYIVYPDESVLFSSGSSTIIFDSQEFREVKDKPFSTSSRFGITYNSQKKRVEWLLYAPDYDPSVGGEPIQKKIIGRNIKSLNFKYDNVSNPQLITIRLRTIKKDEDEIYLLSRIFIRY